MKSDVRAFIRGCEVCQQQKTNHSFIRGLLKALQIPSQPWTHVTINIIEVLPSSNGFNALWVFVGRLTRYSHFLGHPYFTKSVSHLFVKHVLKLHGLPLYCFRSRRYFPKYFLKGIIQGLGAQLEFITAYQPQQTNSQFEVVYKCLEIYVRQVYKFSQVGALT